MSMYKSLKDSRRRISQTVLSKVGSADETKDIHYDTHVHKFHSMIDDMNQCEELLTNLVSRQNDLFSHSEVVAKSLENIYYKNNHMTDWPDCECELIYDLQAGNYCDSIKAINKVTRSTANLVLTDKAIEPIRAATTVMKEELDSLIKERQLKVTDYDSYRRRLTEKEAKYAALVSKGKGESSQGIESLADVDKFKNKTQKGLDEFMYLNEKVKVDILAAKADHDQIMDSVLIALMISQADLFATAARQIEDVITTLPPERVALVRERFATFLKSGSIGIASAPSVIKSSSSDVTNSSRYIYDEDDEEDTAIVAAAAPVVEKNLLDLTETFENSKPFAAAPVVQNIESTHVAPLSPQVHAPVQLPVSTSQKQHIVKAVFDHAGEDEDELTFEVGDIIEVIDSSDEGWWRGRFNGAEGLFPVNFVEVLET